MRRTSSLGRTFWEFRDCIWITFTGSVIKYNALLAVYVTAARGYSDTIVLGLTFDGLNERDTRRFCAEAETERVGTLYS